ncbi:hypothetical protein FO519_008324 [Halicephalobus sp. NKZ332]|nr:hypothetical protein FO519_008324 [Halicephalobus sp. NKZ332]
MLDYVKLQSEEIFKIYEIAPCYALVLNSRTIIYLGVITVEIAFIYLLIVIVSMKTYLILKKNQGSFTEKTFQVHKQLLVALWLQCLVPFVLMFIPLICCIGFVVLNIPGVKADVRQYEYPISHVLRDWTKQYGPVYGIMEGWKKTWVISDPKTAHEMLVKKFEYFHGRKPDPLMGNVDKAERMNLFSSRGARWKRLRTISSSSFNINNLKKIYPTVDDSCLKLMDFVDKAYEEGKPFNIHPYFHELTMDVIMRVAMGQRDSKLFDNPYVGLMNEFSFRVETSLLKKFALIIPPLGWFFRLLYLLYLSMTNNYMKSLLTELTIAVRERKKLKASGELQSNSERVDFIDLFIDAEDPTVKDGEFEKTGIRVLKKMTEAEIVGNCFIFLIAGFDTTANTLGVTCHFLAKHPEVQERVFEEIQDVVMDEKITFEKVSELKYMDVVMKEVLRMFPIAAFAASRECMYTTTLGDCKIEAGENVNVDVLTLHYNKEIWGENADEFVPERFFDFTAEQQMIYYPFGGGPRTCIGMRLAYLEEKLALYYILKKYRIVRTPESEKAPKMVGRNIESPESIIVKLEKR